MSATAPEGGDAEAPVVAAPVVSDAEPTEAFEPPLAPPAYLPLQFIEVAMVLPSTHPVLVLEAEEPAHRQLRIPIGVHEGIAIAYAARGLQTARPLTHELFAAVLERHAITLEVVRIVAVNQAVYEAELIFTGPSGTRVVDARPSDAVALALRQRVPAPITVAPAVLDQVGFAPGDAGA